MKLRLRARSWFLIAVGVAFTLIEVYGCWEYLSKQHGRISYVVILGAAVTGAASLIPMAVELAYRDRRYFLAFLITLAFVPASVTILLAGIERTGSAKDVTVQSQLDHAIKVTAALKAETEAKTDVDTDEAVARADCKTGREKVCKGLEARAENSRQRLRQARLDVIAAGAPPLDALSRRLAEMLPLTERHVQLYVPLILPLTGSILGVLFLAVGCRLEHEGVPERRSTNSLDEKPRTEPSAPSKPARKTDNVIPISSVRRFVLACLAPAEGGRLAMKAVYASYVGWCAVAGLPPAPLPTFLDEIESVCRKAGITIEVGAGGVYCLNVRLAA